MIPRNGTDPQILSLQERYRGERVRKVRAKILERIGQYYSQENNRTLALLCLDESLRLDPKRVGIAEILEPLMGEPETLPRLRSQQNACMVSVIVPTYNRPAALKECLSSILNQTFQDFEIIVINDAGTDESKSVIDSFRSNKIRYLTLTKNVGQPRARNEGLLRARGKYIAYLDDDDIYYNDHLQLLVDFLEAHPAIDVVYSNAWWVEGGTEAGVFKPHCRKEIERPKKFYKNILLEGNFISILNVLQTRKSLETAGLFNEKLPFLEDWDLLLRMARTSKFHQLNRMTGEYRWKEDNQTELRRSEHFFWEAILRNYYIYFRGKVGLATHFLCSNKPSRTDHYMNAIEGEYPGYFKTVDCLREIGEIALAIGREKFFKRVVKDLFEFRPRELTYETIRKKSFLMASAIIPSFPARLLKAVIQRAGDSLVSAGLPLKIK